MIEISKAVINKNGKYLLGKRARQAESFPGLWDFFGGRHEVGETALESIIREVKEETSLNIKPGTEVRTVAYKNSKYDILIHYFVPGVAGGNIKLSKEHSDYGWFLESEIKELKLHPSVLIFFGY